MADSGPSSRELTSLGASVAGAVILGLVVGYLLDDFCGTTPVFLLGGLAVGVVVAVVVIAVQVRRFATVDSSVEQRPAGAPSAKEALG